MSEQNNGHVYLKMESEQYTGSFKFRGAINKLLSLSPKEKKSGIITASTGNHAQGVARACKITNTKGTIFLPVNASKSKIQALERYPVHLEFFDGTSLDTEIHAKKFANKSGAHWVSPYNDTQIIAGQGTIGVELQSQMEKIDAVFVTVGGGGLISGIARCLKTDTSSTKIIGCQPENSPEMYLSVKRGKIVEIAENKVTLSDGSAGGIEEGSITFPICQELIDEFILVPENEIKDAIKLIFEKHHKVIEGSAAVAVAAYLQRYRKLKGKEIAIVICGGNIDNDLFKKIICS